MKYIFIDSKNEFNRIGIVENHRLVEYHLEKRDNENILGNIYRSRIKSVLHGMEAAFVDIGDEKNAYLYIKDALPKELLYSKGKYKISEIIKPGDEAIVQVIKEAHGNKGAKITTHIEIPGRYLVLTPFSNKINISRKINSPEELNNLKTIGKRIIKDNTGVIFRTASESVDEETLQKEYEILFDIYKKIEREKNFLPCPKLLYKESKLSYQILRDSFDENTRIIVNNKEVYGDLILMEEYFPFKFSQNLVLDLNYDIDYDPLIQKEIKQAIEKKVNLNSGGYIVIDETEALTAIDVNTGKFVGSHSLRDTILKVNVEAAEEIAKQIRLRDIGGIIIIDFIDMKSNDDVKQVLNHLEEYLKKDRIKVNIIDITKLGLVELTRKKMRRRLSVDFYKTCPECQGKGNILIN